MGKNFLIDMPIDSPQTPLVLLIYAVETFVTTAVCIAEYVAWPLTVDEKINLTTLYGPYLVLCESPCRFLQ